MSWSRCWSFDPYTGEQLTPCRQGKYCTQVHPDSPRWRDASINRGPRPRSPVVSPVKPMSDRSRWNDPHDGGAPPANRSVSASSNKDSRTISSSSGWGGPPKSGWGDVGGASSVSTNKEREPSSPITNRRSSPPLAMKERPPYQNPLLMDVDAASSVPTNKGEPSSPITNRRPSPPPPTNERPRYQNPLFATDVDAASSVPTAKEREPSSLNTNRRASPPPAAKERTRYQNPVLALFPPVPSPPPPPLPASSALLHPLPPNPMHVHNPTPQVPESTSSTSIKGQAASTAPTLQGDLRKAYLNRVTVLSEAVHLNNEYIQAIHTLEARRRMLSSHQYSHVSESSQSKLNTYALEYEEKARDLKTRLSDTLSKLVEFEAWPSGPLMNDPEIYDGALKRFEEFQERLKALEDDMKDVKTERRPPSPPHEMEPSVDVKDQLQPLVDVEDQNQPSVDVEDQNQPSVDVEDHHQPSVDVEDRRLNESIDAAVLSRLEQLEHRRNESIDADVLNRLEQLELRFDDVSNETMQQAENFLQIAESRIEEKLEGLERPQGRAANMAPDVEMHDDEGDDAADTREQVSKLSQDFEAFMEESVDLVQRYKDLALKVRKVSQENELLKIQKDELVAAHENLKGDMASLEGQVRAVISAVKIIKTSPNTDPTSRTLEPFRAQIREEILDDLRPVLLEFRQQCEALVTSWREEALKHMTAELKRTVDKHHIKVY